MNSTSLVFIVCFLSFAAMSSLAAQEQTMKPYFEFTLPYVDTAKGKNETITRAEIDSLWNEFKEREKNHREALAEEAGMSKESVNLQRDCEHAHWPFEGDEYKGVVVLFHGFSACPQQYHEVGPLMAKKGYEVFAPTIVGHGYVYTWNEPEELQGFERVQAWMWKLLGSEKTKPVSATDNFFALPYEEKYYAEYVKRVNEMMKKMPAPRVVVGLSLGGAVAMYTGATTVGKDSTEAMYERQLLTVPVVQFYHPAVSQTVEFTTHSNWEKMGKRARSFLPSWLVFDGLARMDFGWGPNCEVQRTEGRAGICQFAFGQMDTCRDLGRDTAKLIAARKNKLENQKTQMVLVEGDMAVGNDAAREFFENMPEEDKSLCMGEKEMQHSFLSRHDNAGKNMFWIKETMENMVGFVSQYEGNKLTAEGFVQIDGEIASEKAPRCKMECSVSKSNIDTAECMDQEVVEGAKYEPQIPMSDELRQQHERHKAASESRFVGLRVNDNSNVRSRRRRQMKNQRKK